MSDDLSHVDGEGRARMVDVSSKPETARLARAEARVVFSPGVRARVLAGDLPKGPVLETARLAGVTGAKRTSDLIPMCHPLRISEVKLDFAPEGDETLVVTGEVRAVDRTGVEMEALTAVTVAALTVYDMVKAVDRGMEITSVRLTHKEGGKTGTWSRDP
jgi:cyclic pyranopterin phosphate synthase